MRDPGSTSYVGSFAPAEHFATLVHAEARRRGADRIRQLVVLGDGAPWIWKLATAIVPEATPIVDIYHAREHLHDLAAGLAPVLGDGHDDWLHARLADLDAGDIEALVTETTRLPLDGDTAKALAYFKTNAHRMRYAYFREHGMFIGSGTVEAGCKAVIGQRLKLSGMRWNIPGATGILTLRCEQAGDRFEHIWTRPTPGTAGRGSTAVPGIMRLCLTTDEWLSGMGFRFLYPRVRCRDCIEIRYRPGGKPPCRNQVSLVADRRGRAGVQHGGIVVTTGARADCDWRASTSGDCRSAYERARAG